MCNNPSFIIPAAYTTAWQKIIHPHYGLQTAELPEKLPIARSLERQNVLENVQHTCVLIWDEMSISSERLRYNIKLIHQIASDNSLPSDGVHCLDGETLGT